ncbi:1-aminocyclopropane-1-carboxylate oxidase homolog 1-like [Prunus avium]|uniref:1-aminocyclopropane-1-carboxylate oxidase homolog 1-like n=1 Tax=Prunus avium TaxID=42229 RepID=A0A6P5T312_PRUAV|nr:1-aminocyclopropane-1-carboxylate oxidase homolog 1-like [Prunus avium]
MRTETQAPYSTHETMAANTTVIGQQDYDRAQQVKQFDQSKLGVKGLVDSGLTSIPRFFIHPPETLADLRPHTKPQTQQQPIPTIDLSDLHTHRRSSIVQPISCACRTFGFFQITNHGIPSAVLDRTIAGIKAFHEQPTEVKAPFYSREMGTGVSYLSNVDLYSSKAASWRDTLQVRLGPIPAVPEEVPEICRDEIVGWDVEIRRLGEALMELLSEGLGLNAGRLREMTCLGGRVMAAHYYPYCPQSDLTVGLTSHSDPGVLTVVLQDHMGGLQVKHGEDWVDVKPVPGALVINVGDLLQIMSNGEYKSVDHRVLANSNREPRVSTAVFFNPSNREGTYGPLPELVAHEKPPLYREFTFSEFMQRFFNKGLDGKALVNHFEL